MTIRMCAKVLLHVWSYDFYDTTLSTDYCIKAVPYTVNSRALTGEKACINKGFLVLLMHRKLTFSMIVPGPLKLFRHTPFNCHNTINWWCNRPIKMDPFKKKKKKETRAGF